MNYSMNYIENTIDIFNLPFTLKDFSEYNEGYLAAFSLDIPFDDSYGISHKLFSNITMFISILEQKFYIVAFDSLDKNELTLYLVGGDDN